MSENRLAELFCEMAEHEGKTDVVRQILTQKCSDMQNLYESVMAGHHRTITRNALLQFLALESPTAARDLASSVDSFLDLHSSTGQLTLGEFQKFVLANRRQPARKMYTPDRYELRYTLFLLFVKEIENCQREVCLMAAVDPAEAIRAMFQGDGQVLTLARLLRFCKQNGKEINAKKAELLWRRLGRACRRRSETEITLKEFGNMLSSEGVASKGLISKPSETLTQTPKKAEKKPEWAEKSTNLKSTQKKQMRLELQDLSRQVKRKVHQASLSQVLTKKMLAFVIAACRRDKQVNAHKSDLFSHGLGLIRLFRQLDSTCSQFVTAQQLQPFFGSLSDVFAFFYGHEGIIRFSDFAKMLIPVSYTQQELQSAALDELQLDTWERVGKVLRLMAEAEASNFKDIEKLAAEFRQKDRAELFRAALFQQERLNQAAVLDLLTKNSMIMSELELTLLFRKFDRDCDGYITIDDFSPYLRG